MSLLTQRAFLIISFFGLNLSALNIPSATKTVEAVMVPATLGHKHCGSVETVRIEKLPLIAEDDDFHFTHHKFDEKNPKGNCPEKLAQGDLIAENIFTVSKPTISNVGEKLLPKNACQDGEGAQGIRELCIYRDRNLIAKVRYGFDTTKAVMHGYKDIKAVNGEVSFSIDSRGGRGDDTVFEVCYGEKDLGPIDATDNNECKKSGFNLKSQRNAFFKFDGLNSDKTYAFKGRLIVNAQKTDWWKPFEKTPSEVYFPLNYYNGSGGDLQFSCEQSGGSALVLLFTLSFLILWRYRRNARTYLVLLTVCSLSMPKTTRADVGQMSFGILGAMYRPDLDSEKLSSGKPINPFYREYFRSKKSDQEGPILPLIGAEVDWHLWDGFGSIQLGFGASYTFVRGYGLKKKGGKPDPDSGDDGARAALHMYQLRPQLTYVFNPFVDKFPLAPYLRAALIGQGYNFTHDGKDLSKTTAKPNGFRFGYQFALGLMFMLDFLEPSAVSGARSAGLFEHVYLKAELSYTKIDSFGTPGFQFSPKDIMGTSLPLLWTFGLVFELPN